ncbi:uncharacterized protein METZ01_LOCUS11634 [marine metagenome]|uniref:Uncharacterized protein n=1 Tax=marine metagenome TaxID=408172 RepID=A0A381NW45_9ZZZZ
MKIIFWQSAINFYTYIFQADSRWLKTEVYIIVISKPA